MGVAVSKSRLRFGVAVSVVAALAVPSWVAAAQNEAGSSGSGGTIAPRVVVGAGDISTCSNANDSATAGLVKGVLATDTTAVAITMGDNVYPSGTGANYKNCYGPTWGTFKARTRPVPGNHDVATNPRAYYNYFGKRAGRYLRGYYKADFGTWRVFFLTSECGTATACFQNQLSWISADMDAHPHLCTMAIWHRARFSSGAEHGSSTRMATVFQLLYDKGADVVLTGHDHHYERFAPVDPTGAAAVDGIRQFVSGLGGGSRYALAEVPHPASEFRYNDNYGVLKLTLGTGTYDWEFMTIADETVDQGTGACH
jgi:hypothetical protein